MRVALRRSLLEDHILQVAAHRSQPTTRYSHDHCKMSHAETLRLLLHLPDGTSWTRWNELDPLDQGIHDETNLNRSMWLEPKVSITHVGLGETYKLHLQVCVTTYKYAVPSARLRYYLQACGIFYKTTILLTSMRS